MQIYSFTHYRDFLAKQSEPWGEISRMAKAASCQRSLLSRAIKGELLLTPDHGHALCEYWRLGEEEREYFMLLLERERAATKDYRAHLEKKIERVLRARENLAQRLETPALTKEWETTYYSAWFWSAIHICTSVPHLQTESALSQVLHLHPELVKHCLRSLEHWNLVQRKGKRWEHSSSNFHLPKNSPLIGQYHTQWRQQALSHCMVPGNAGLHYTQLQAMDTVAFRKIKELLLQAIEDSLKVGDAAESTNVVALSLDVFPVAD